MSKVRGLAYPYQKLAGPAESDPVKRHLVKFKEVVVNRELKSCRKTVSLEECSQDIMGVDFHKRGISKNSPMSKVQKKKQGKLGLTWICGFTNGIGGRAW